MASLRDYRVMSPLQCNQNNSTPFLTKVFHLAIPNCYPNVLPNELYSLVLGPIVEETFFRGYVLGSMSKLGKYGAVVVSAFLFSTAHYMVSLAFATAVYYFIGGLILGWAYLYFGSILIPIIYHQAVNILLSGFYPPYVFPWNFVGYLLYLAPYQGCICFRLRVAQKAYPSYLLDMR
jgi:membrane protease YdiL (CAAX protease family)